MIALEQWNVYGWEAAIRGMRNPMNSWEKSDSWFHIDTSPYDEVSLRNISGEYRKLDAQDYYEEVTERHLYPIGPADHKLMMTLAKSGTEHAKYRRMINVTVDITAPLYWWKEFDTYKIGTVANSCSTMHKIAAKEFTPEDFSIEHLGYYDTDREEHDQYYEDAAMDVVNGVEYPYDLFTDIIAMLNHNREKFLETRDKKFWWQMIQLLPSSYNQRRTVQLNYEVLSSIYRQRRDHKLDEWHVFCDWIKKLPYSELITMEEK